MENTWASKEFSLEPLLRPIYPIIETLDGVLSFLIAVLNVVQKILDVLKAFLVGLLDPIRPLVELIISEIRAVINDLRQIGLYLAGDWALLDRSNNQAYLLGGYAAYEQRMVARLLDTTDPGRPNFSSSSEALGVFLYASSGDISDIVRVARAIMNLFGRGDLLGKSGPYPTPTTPTVAYGSWSDGVSSFQNLAQSFDNGVPDAISVTWSMPSGTTTSPFRSPAPKGFLVHVSTIPDGLQVVASTSNPSSANPKSPERILGGGVDPITNNPLKLYGGVADIGVSANAQDFSSVEQVINPQAPLLFLLKDKTTPLIKPSSLVTSDGVPLIGNTFYAKMSDLAPQRIGGGTRYTATIRVEDLPLEVSFKGGADGFAEIDGNPARAKNYWVRVRAVSSNFVSEARGSGLSGTLSSPGSVYASNMRIYQFSNPGIKGAALKNGVLIPEAAGFRTTESVLSFKDLTAASGAGVITLPTDKQKSYTRAVQSALALAILCRGDLTEGGGGNPTNVFATGFALGFESCLRNILGSLGFDPSFFKESRPQVFRQKLRSLLNGFLVNAPPDAVVDTVIANAKDLLEFTWNQIDSGYPRLSILESIGIGGDPAETEGVGANPFCRTIDAQILTWCYALPASTGNKGGPERSPSFLQKPPKRGWVAGNGSADYSPILYQDGSPTSTKVRYVRNAAWEHNSQELLRQANFVLTVATCSYARPPTDGGWLAIRLMPEALLPVDALLSKIDKFLQGILDGLQGVIDQIIKYIEAIQARIFQLQALLELIQSLLNSITLFQLPSLSVLALVAEGTAGLTTGLLASENKPADDSSDYGFGVLAVAGGIPSFLIELLALIFSGGG